jgi:hypothetical protein
MEMDLGTAIIGLISILICIIPFIIMRYNRIKKEKILLQNLSKIADQHNCKISNYEFCGDFVIGINYDKNLLFFYKKNKVDSMSQYVNLLDMHICKVVKSLIHNDKSSFSQIERLELVFYPKNKNNFETRFELFNLLTNVHLSGELQFADKWSNQINNLLIKKK